jgi:hypothetical protein
MKSAVLFLSIGLFAACLWAQNPAPAPPPPPPQAMHHGMHHPDMAAMHAEHMQHMKDQVAKMRSTLDQMKANLDKLQDPAAKQQAQLDVDMWEAMVTDMEGMMSMMSAHTGMGMGMGMKGAPAKTPPAPDQSPVPKK